MPCTYCNDSGWVMISKPGAMDSKGNLHMIQFPNPCSACHSYEQLKASLSKQLKEPT